MGVERLVGSLTRLHDALAELRLPLDIPDAAANRTLAQAQAGQIQDYVLPRLRRLDAPLLAVVGGSTGAGKSTLVNSLVGRVVSESGVIRPTTRSSVLIHHPNDAHWFASSQILPGLARSDGAGTDPRVLQLVPEPGLPEGLAILDAPDVDSVVAQNRTLAAQLLAAADLWLFVTSAARYADAVPWEYLREAAARRAVVAVVLDRVPSEALGEVPAHLGQMMSQRGLESSPLFAVPETRLDSAGMLPDAAAAPIRSWLHSLAQDATRRNEVVLQTLDGAIESLATQGRAVVQAATDQVDALATLRADAEKSFAEATRAVAAQTADGTLLRGEVLARWQDFVGTGEFFRAIEKRIGLFRDRVGQAMRGEPKRAQEVKLAVESGLEVLIREEGEAASRRSVSAWEAHPAGRQILAQDDTLGRLSSGFAEAAPRVIREWQGDVLELVTSEGQSKKSTARYLALGVNGAGVALMILVFSQTGGLVGAEIGIAGGTAVLAQRVLEAVFGDDAVRRLSKQAKQQLDDRVQGLMAMELVRFEKVLDELDVPAAHGESVAAALSDLDAARAAADRYQPAAPELPQPPEAPEAPAEPYDPTESGDPSESIVLPAAEPAADPADTVDDGPSGEVEGADSSDDSDDGFEPPEPRPIPIPHDLAELAAEAVRRPDDGSAPDVDGESVPANDEPPAPADDDGTAAGRSEPAMPDSGAALIPPSEPPAPPEVPSWPHPEPLRLPPPPEPPTPTDSIGQE
jgi:energy-coupling factor transporter ATP-binding protein EcfA2